MNIELHTVEIARANFDFYIVKSNVRKRVNTDPPLKHHLNWRRIDSSNVQVHLNLI